MHTIILIVQTPTVNIPHYAWMQTVKSVLALQQKVMSLQYSSALLLGVATANQCKEKITSRIGWIFFKYFRYAVGRKKNQRIHECSANNLELFSTEKVNEHWAEDRCYPTGKTGLDKVLTVNADNAADKCIAKTQQTHSHHSFFLLCINLQLFYPYL